MKTRQRRGVRRSRRQILAGAVGLGMAAAGGALLAGCSRLSAPAAWGQGERPLETTTIRLLGVPSLCLAPQHVADDLLRAEGFREIEHVSTAGGADPFRRLGAGDADFSMVFAGLLMYLVDRGTPIVMLGGVHTGCYELFGTDSVRSISDLKGRSVAVPQLEGSPHIYLSAMMAYVGLDPRTDVTWVTVPTGEAIEMLARGEVDAYLGFPPEPQELRARGIGHVVVSTTTDRPWSQYFCCLLAGNRDFVQQHPEATKRTLRAILKAADVCTNEPGRVADALVARGYTRDRALAEQLVRDIPYSRWREYDPEDTARFYALKMHETGLVKTSLNTLIGQAADFRFFNELKQELKG